MPPPIILRDVTIQATTAKAVLIEYEGGEEWLPISCLDLEETSIEFAKGETGDIAVQAWFAGQKGFA